MGMMALEKRVLLDAAGMATAAEAGSGPDPDHARPDPRDAAAERQVAETIDALGAVSAGDGAGRDDGRQGRTILVVDARVRGADTLLRDLPQGVEVVHVAAGEDGVAKIGELLSSGGPVAALHILAHGEEGSFTLGNRLVDADRARGELAAAFRAWSEGLSAGADILLYGCDTGAGAAGVDLVQTLASLTGADIAASDDATGAAGLGGDWQLEVVAGTIESQLPLAGSALEAWQDRLAAPTITAPAAGYSVSEPSALNDPGASTITLAGLSIADDDLDDDVDPDGAPLPNDTVTVTATIADTALGSLADASGLGIAVEGGFSFTGSRADANAWLGQLTFTAADVETGNSALTTSLVIAVTDAEGLQGSANVALRITPSNDPASLPDGSMSVVEGAASTTVTAAALALSDPELAAGAQEGVQMVYRLTAAPIHGNLLRNGVLLGIGSIFTHDDIVNGRITYQHTATGANQNAQDSFSVSVNDGATPQAGSATATVTIDIIPVNQAPTAGGSATIYEGQPANAQNANAANGGVGAYAQVGAAITVGTGGDPGDSVTIRITSLTSRGTLYYSGTATINGTVQVIDRALTLADITTGSGFVIAAADRANLIYIHDGSEPVGAAATDSFGFSVTDAGGGAGAGAALTTDAVFTINIAPVNDDPVWDPASSLTATVEPAGPDGDAGTAADNYRVVLTTAMLNAGDVDSGAAEISFAMVGDGPQYGQLLKDGVQLRPGDSFSLADVIAGRIVYVQLAVPADPETTDSFQFTVFDNAQSLRWGPDGEDYARQGGIYDGPGAEAVPTRFTFTIHLADGIGTAGGDGGGGPGGEPPQPDPMQILFIGDNPTSTAGGVVLEDGNGIILGDDGDPATDVMLRYTAAGVPADQIVYTVMALDLPGRLQRDTTGSGNWVTLNLFSTFTQADLDAGRIRFVHNGGEDFQGSFDFEVSAGLVDPATLEKITTTGTFTVYVTPVNDAPNIAGSADNILREGEAIAITTGMLSASDPDDASSAEGYLEDPAHPDYVGDNFALNHGVGGGNPLRILITGLPVNGVLQVDTTGSGNWVTITQSEVDGATGNALIDVSWITGAAGTTRLRYLHAGTETVSDSFTAIAIDRHDASSGTATVTFRISAVNDAPEIAPTPSDPDPTEIGRDENAIDGNDQADDDTVRNDPVTVLQGGRVQITAAFLQAYDPDSTTKQVQYRITEVPAHGYIARSTNGVDFTRLGRNAAFTTQDVLDGFIWYIHEGGEPTTDGVDPDDLFRFTLADGDKEQNNNEFHILILPANEKPLISVPSAPVDIASTDPADNVIAGITVNDTDLKDLVSTADGETDFLRVVVRLAHTNGTPFAAGEYADVTIGIAAGSGVVVDADKDGAGDYLVMQGSRAQLNAALAQLSVTFGNDRNAEYRLQIIADDRLRDADGTLTGGANGGAVNLPAEAGGAPGTVPATEYDYYSETPPGSALNFALASILVRASHTNDPPVLTVPPSITVSEDSTGNAVPGVSVADADALSANIQVKITVSAGEGQVTVDETDGVAGTGTGESLTLTGTRAAINAALATLKFTPAADYNNQDGSQASITVEVSDLGSIGAGGSLVDTEVIAVKVDRVNDAPTVGPDPGTQVIDTGTTLVFSAANGNLIQIDDPQDVATDVTDREFTPGQMTVTVTVTAGTVTATTGGGATIQNNGTATVTISGTIAQVNAALDGLVYTAPGADPDMTATMTVTVDDGGNGGAGALQASLSFDIQMSTENDPPVNALPVGFTVAEDADWTLVQQGGQYIQISDPDDFGGNGYSVRLTSAGGQMRLQGSSNVTLTFGNGNASSTTDLTLTGTLADINAALMLLRFRPTGNLHGAAGVASITVQTTDDHPGSLAPETDTDVLQIAVTAVNDAPTASGTYSIDPADEDGAGPAVQLSTLLAAAYSDATDDQDGFTNATTGTAGGDTATALSHVAIIGSTGYTAAQGTWQVQNADGSGWIDIPTSGLSASAALVFAADRLIRFVPAADFHGTPGTLQVRLADGSTVIATSTGSADTKNLTNNGGVGGTGAWSTGSATIQTSVANVNDAPTLTASSAAAGVEDTTPAGQTVAAIVGAQYSDATDDRSAISGGDNAATALGGIAIVGNAATTEGVWQYHDGSQWVDIGEGAAAPSDASAILLPATTLLRFVPAADFNGTPGALTIRASDSPIATIQTGQSIAYSATGQWSLPSTIGITIAARNDAPTISGTATNPVIDENAGLGTGTIGLALVTDASAADAADFAYLAADTFGGGTITVKLTDGYVAGDVLSLAGSPAGVASVTGGQAADLVITLSATATAADVAAILEAIRYNSTSDNPTLYGTDTDRAYSIVLSDGNNDNGSENAGGPTALTSNAITGTITFSVINDAPIVDLNGAGAGTDNTVTFTEGANMAGTPVKIAPAADLSDMDNQNLVQMVLTVAAVPDGAAEVLTIGGTDFALAGTTYTDVAAGGFLVSYDPDSGQFTIRPGAGTVASVAAFETLLQGITYRNDSDTPDTADRSITVAVTDAGLDDSAGGQADGELGSNVATVTIKVVAQNDQPRITGATPVTFLENAINLAAATLDSDFGITEPDSAHFNGGSLTVGGLVAGEDIVSLPGGSVFPDAPADGQVFLDTATGKVHVYDAGSTGWVEIGTASGGNGADFVIAFTSDEATVARVERVLESLTFRNTSDTPTVSRTLTLLLDDGGGQGITQAATLAVGITRQNDPASVTASDVNVSEGSATLVLDASNAAITVADLDQPGTFSATVTVSKGTISAVGGAGGVVDGIGTATITISGATQAELNSRLQALTIQFIDEPAGEHGDPGRVDWNGSFTVTVTVDDGGSGQTREAGGAILGDTDNAGANPGDFAYADGVAANILTTRTIQVTVAAVNDAPVATAGTVVELPAMDEDTAEADLPVKTVAELAADRFADPIDAITDGSVPDAFHGIAIVGNTVDAAKGAWEYQIDGSGPWIAVGDRTLGNALVLDANDRLRFRPAANYFGAAPQLSVLVVEDGNDAGDAGPPAGGTTLDLTGAIGGTSRYSATGFNIGTTVNAVNDAPEVDLNGAAAGTDTAVTFTEGANVAHEPVKIAAAGTLGDIDNTNLVAMTLTVGGVVDGDAEVLNIGGTDFTLDSDHADVDVGAFRISYDAASGVFTIQPSGGGVATLAAFQMLLQGITYSNTSDNPTAGDRTVHVQVQDAGIDDAGDAFRLDSNTALATVTVVPSNDQPRLVVDAAEFLENALNQGALRLDSSITLVDADSADFAGGSLVVSGLVAGQDVVSLPLAAPDSPADGDVWLDDGTVRVYQDGSWIAIGTATGGAGADFTISFTSAEATRQRVQWVIEALTFRNTSDTPVANRTLTLTLSDGDAGGSVAAADLPVTIIPENDPVSVSANAVTVAEGSATVVLDASNAAFDVSDPDIGAGLFTATVTVSRGTITAVGGAGGAVTGAGSSQVTITGASQAELVSRLRALTVTLPDVAGTPDSADWNGQFSVTVVVNDNGGSGQRPGSLIGDSNDATADPGDFAYADGVSAALQTTRTIIVTVTAVNDAPVASSTATVTLPAIDEDLADADNAGVTVASFAQDRFDDSRDQIGDGGSDANAFHGIAIVGAAADPAKGSWQYRLDDSTDWLPVGDRSLANALVLGAADRIRFVPAQDYNGPAPALTVRLVENGGADLPPAGGSQVDLSGPDATGGTSRYSGNGFDIALNVTPISDPPTVDLNGAGAGTGSTVTWSENAAGASLPVKIAEQAVLADIDNVNLVQMVLTVAGLQNGNDEVLNIGGTDFALATDATDADIGDFLVSVDAASGTITIVPKGTAFDALARFQDLLRNITYNNASADPGTTARTVTVEIRDAGNDDAAGANQRDSNKAVATIKVVPENNRPQIAGVDSATFLENELNHGVRFLDTAIDLSDSDSPHFNGGRLVVSGLVAGEDRVSLPEGAEPPAAPADGDVWRDTDDNRVYVRDGGAWIEIGTASGGDGSDFVIAFTSTDATVARVERVLESLTFSNSSDTPTANRTLSITVDDGGPGGTSSAASLPVTIIPENDPARVTATAVQVAEGAATLVLDASNAAISVADPDLAGGLMDARLTVSAGIIAALDGAGGTVTGLGTDTVLVQGVTQAELVAYLQALTIAFPDAPGLADAADWNGSLTLTLVVDDRGNSGQRPGSLIGDGDDPAADPGDFDYANGSDPDLTTTRTVAILVTAVNDAPVALNSSPVMLPAILETVADAANTGQDIASIAASKFSDPRDEIPGGSSANAFHGIAITGHVPDGSGIWQYQLDGSGPWVAIGARGPANALVLDANDRIRFVPAPDYNGTPPGLTAILVEDGNGVPPAGGTVVDLSGAGTGGTTRYAALASAFAIGIQVTAVNTAPTADSNGADAGTDRTIRLVQSHDGPNVLDAVPLFLGTPIADRDNLNLTSVTVQVGGLRDGAAEILRVHGVDLSLAQAQSVAVGGNVTVSIAPGGDGATVTLTRTGGGVLSVADANAALLSMSYRNVAGSPTIDGVSRSFQLSAVDAGLDDAGGADRLGSNIARVTLETEQGNRPPVAVLDTATTDEVTPVSGQVLGNDSDPDGDSLTVGAQVVRGSAGGTFTIRPDGSYTFDPGSDFLGLSGGQSQVTEAVYTVTDPGGLSATATIRITVTGISTPGAGPGPAPVPPSSGPGTAPAPGGGPDATPTPPPRPPQVDIPFNTGPFGDYSGGGFGGGGAFGENGQAGQGAFSFGNVLRNIGGLATAAGGNGFTRSLDLSQNPIRLTIALDAQVVGDTGAQSFSLPANAFQHTDPSVEIRIEVTLADGSPLPKYIQFNPQTLNFLVNPDLMEPGDPRKLDLKVTGRDPDGNEASTTFTLTIGGDGDDELIRAAITSRPFVQPIELVEEAPQDGVSEDGQPAEATPAEGEAGEGEAGGEAADGEAEENGSEAAAEGEENAREAALDRLPILADLAALEAWEGDFPAGGEAGPGGLAELQRQSLRYAFMQQRQSLLDDIQRMFG